MMHDSLTMPPLRSLVRNRIRFVLDVLSIHTDASKGSAEPSFTNEESGQRPTYLPYDSNGIHHAITLYVARSFALVAHRRSLDYFILLSMRLCLGLLPLAS